MSEMNSDFINEVCEYIFGDEYTKQDQRNILRNINPPFEGTGILKFGTILNSQHFMEFVVDLWETKQNLYEARRTYKKSLKTEKDYNVVCNKLNQEREDCKNKILEIKEKCESIQQDHVNKNPIYKKLENEHKRLYYQYKQLENKLENQDRLKEQITNATLDKSDAEVRFKEFYQERYKKDKKELDKEIDKYKKEYVRQDDKIIFMEKNNEIKKLKKQVKNLQEQIISSMD